MEALHITRPDRTPDGRGKGITVLGSAPVTVEEATLFAFDDVSIPYSTNLKVDMVSPVKHADNPLIPLGKTGNTG